MFVLCCVWDCFICLLILNMLRVGRVTWLYKVELRFKWLWQQHDLLPVFRVIFQIINYIIIIMLDTLLTASFWTCMSQRMSLNPRVQWKWKKRWDFAGPTMGSSLIYLLCTMEWWRINLCDPTRKKCPLQGKSAKTREFSLRFYELMIDIIYSVCNTAQQQRQNNCHHIHLHPFISGG